VKLKRRGFLKLAGLTAAGLSAASGPSGAEGDHVPPADAFGVLADLSLCVGCRSCEKACNRVNELPAPDRPFSDKTVFSDRRRGSEKAYTVVNRYPNADRERPPVYKKIQCMHCQDPACVSACLVGAMQKTELGPVIWEDWRCMGCRYCMIACPFGVPAFEYQKGIEPRIMKCTMCHPRIKEGRLPGCVEACPMEVLKFGRRAELIGYAKRRIAASPERYADHVYGEKEVGGTSWLYIAPQDLSTLDFLNLPDNPPPRLTEGIQHGIFKHFIPPVLLTASLGALMYASHPKEPREPAPPPEKPADEGKEDGEVK